MVVFVLLVCYPHRTPAGRNVPCTPLSPTTFTAQVASQQGAYLARLFSRGFEVSAAVPQKQIPDKGTVHGGTERPKSPLSEKLGLSVVQGKFAKPFQFLNLGILAYTGAGGALAQVQVGVIERRGYRWSGTRTRRLASSIHVAVMIMPATVAPACQRRRATQRRL